jgi:hypothetical protein
MKTIAALIWTGLALLQAHAGDTNTVPARVAGSYYHGDGLGMNITITVSTNQKYTAGWSDCIGSCGAAAGSWSNANDMLYLTPTNETGMFRSHRIRLLRVRDAANLIVTNSSKALEGKTFSNPPRIKKRTRTNSSTHISGPARDARGSRKW